MSSIDTDDAIDKLAEYRKTSKQPSDWDKQPKPKEIEDTSIRQFFIKYYWVNVVISSTLGFALLIGITSVLTPLINIMFAGFAFLLSRQTMKTIERLARTNGRDTTIDDVFVILLLALAFFGFLLFFPENSQMFVFIHIVLAILWVLQIIFVNYRKPDFGTIATKKVETADLKTETMSQRIVNFLTRDRLIALGISFVLGLIVVLQSQPSPA